MPPFTILHVCMGNICRSPMAERLTALALGEQYVHTHSVGTGGWHTGGRMEPGAARQVSLRGGAPDAFRARKLAGAHVDASDLILTATADQYEYVLGLRADADERTFVLGQFGRLLPSVDLSVLPAAADSADAVHARGVALVAAVDAVRAGKPPRYEDDLEDPYGCGDAVFGRVADTIAATVDRLAAALLPAHRADQGLPHVL
jgi:protein-tyrosine phosphatase